VYTVLHPSTSSPQWVGPLYVYDVMYQSTGPYTDFYFICRINYDTHHQQQQQAGDDGARFEVVLTFDSQLSSVTKTTTSSSLDVRFTSQDVRPGFGTQVRVHSLFSLSRCECVPYRLSYIDFYRATLCYSAVYDVALCLSVRLS